MRAEFEAAHKAQFGFVYPARHRNHRRGGEVESVGGDLMPGPSRTARETQRWRSDRHGPDENLAAANGMPPSLRPRPAHARGMTGDRPCPDHRAHQTVVVEPGWQASHSARPHRADPREKIAATRLAIGTEADPVMLEVFNNLFMSIAEQMGVTLQNTAYSVNIKERLDFSCAVFDADPARWSPTRRTCRCIWAPWTARWRPSSARTKATCGRAMSYAERALQWRHPPARHHGRHAGVRRGRSARSCSGSPRAATTPMSAARRPAP
jgi:hypothetical protein